MITIRPGQKNMSRDVEIEEIRKRIPAIVAVIDVAGHVISDMNEMAENMYDHPILSPVITTFSRYCISMNLTPHKLPAVLFTLLLLFALPAVNPAGFFGVNNPGTALAQTPLDASDLSGVRSADITDAQLRTYIRRARDEGISESEAFALARERGLPASEEQALRSRIRNLEQDIDEDNDTPAEPRATPEVVEPAEPAILQPDRTPGILPTPAETEAEREARAVQRTVRAMDEEIDDQRIFGHNLFTDQTLDVFRTTEGARAPDSYIMGPGDQIRINIFGTSQADLLLEINDEGYIQPSGMPIIFLKGLTLREARNVLRERLSNFYTFQSDQFALSIHSARTITINVFGESNVRGSFTVSALNTAFNALAAAGGPTEMGSVRNIQLIRGDDRRSLDVYEFMFDPAVQFDFDLRHNDILYVPVADKVVSMRGAVKRPMRYELADGEDLRDLIRYAGGINFDTAPEFIQVQRIVDDEPVLLEWRLTEVLSGEEQVDIEDGDIVRVRTIGRPLEQFVEIEGSVYYPGRFSLSQSPTLNTLLKEAQLRPQAKDDLIFVERRQLDESVRIIPVTWELMQARGEDFELERRDRIIVFDRARFRDIAAVAVVGDVRNPIERSLQYDERISIGNALELAGGLRPTAAETAYIFRTDLFNPDFVEHIRVDLIRDRDFELQPGDQLNVYDRSTYSDVGQLSIGGMVNDPFRTQFDPELSIHDLLTMSGGFQRGAALNRVDVFRLDISFRQGTTYDVITLTVDSLYNVTQAPAGFRLQPFDQVVVRRIPQFDIARSVQIDGEVQYPGLYPLESRRAHLSDLIVEAGGLTDVADNANATLLRTHNNMGPVGINLRDAMRWRGDQSYDPVIFDDDIVTIPKFSNTVTILPNATRLGELQDFGVAQMPGAVTGLPDTIVAAQQNLNIVFEGDKSAKWYIENFAGGFAEDADRWSVTVTTPSGKVKGTKRRMLFFRNYPKVEPGSTIALRMEPPPPPEEERDPFDFDRAFSRTMQTTTTLLTILVLLDRLN